MRRFTRKQVAQVTQNDSFGKEFVEAFRSASSSGVKHAPLLTAFSTVVGTFAFAAYEVASLQGEIKTLKATLTGIKETQKAKIDGMEKEFDAKIKEAVSESVKMSTEDYFKYNVSAEYAALNGRKTD